MQLAFRPSNHFNTSETVTRPLGRDYYVDQVGGSDANSGLSPSEPWQTITKVNAGTFVPTDRILLRRNRTWVGTRLLLGQSGSAYAPITCGAYGDPALPKPVIDGNDAVDCVSAAGKSYLTFQDLEATQGFDFGFSFSQCHHIELVDCDSHDFGNDGLLFIQSCYDCTVTGGKFYNGYQRAGGIVTGIEVADACHDIVVTGAEAYGNTGSGCGFDIHSHDTSTMPYNITFQNCYGHDNAWHGMSIWKNDNNVDTDRNIRILDSTFTNNGSRGIFPRRVAPATAYPNGVLVQGCIMRGNLDTQMWVYEADNVVVLQSVFDSLALAGDYSMVYQNCKGGVFYNNSFYMAQDTSASGPFAATGGRNENLKVKNNVFWATNDAPFMIVIPAGTGIVGTDIDYNLYRDQGALVKFTWLGVNYDYAGWLANSGQDANSPPRGDPLYTNPGAGDFTLQEGSPAIDAGVDVGLPWCRTAPDCGAYEKCP